MENNAIELKNLVIGYKTSLCDAINLTCATKDLICLIGRNGSGKTSLLNTISGIIPAISGNIYFFGQNKKDISLNQLPLIVSYVPSKLDYLQDMTVNDLASLGRSPHTNMFDHKSEEDKRIIDKYLYDFNLDNLRHKPLWKLSDGERQKVMICRAFIQETPIILLDEPNAFLDYYNREMLMSELLNLTTTHSKSIIFSSHDIATSIKYSSKIWLLDNKTLKEVEKQDFKL